MKTYRFKIGVAQVDGAWRVVTIDNDLGIPKLLDIAFATEAEAVKVAGRLAELFHELLDEAGLPYINLEVT